MCVEQAAYLLSSWSPEGDSHPLRPQMSPQQTIIEEEVIQYARSLHTWKVQYNQIAAHQVF